MLAMPQQQKGLMWKGLKMAGKMTLPRVAGRMVFSRLSTEHTAVVTDCLTQNTDSTFHTVTTTPNLKKLFFLLNFYAICIYKNPSARD